MADRKTTTEFGSEQQGFGTEQQGFENEQENMLEHEEGPVARRIEQQTAKLPSDFFLWASVASMGWSLACKMTGRDAMALFVGQWAPTFLIFGLYNKIVKVAGSDRMSQMSQRSRVFVP